MRIAVEPMTFELAELTVTPSLWRRIFLGERTETRFAVRTRYGHWLYDDTQAPILNRRIEDELDRSRVEAMLIARASSGVAPPVR